MSQAITQKILSGIENNVYTNVEMLVSRSGEVLYHQSTGRFENPDKAIFDLASLTKPLCTALLFAIFCEEKPSRLNDTVDRYFPTDTLSGVTMGQLLNHSSGIIDWAPFYVEMIKTKNPNFKRNKEKIFKIILTDDNILRRPGRTLYSDVGYILLGAVLEQMAHAGLNNLFRQCITDKLKISDKIFFAPLNEPPAVPKEFFVPTEDCPLRKKIVQGEVMDRNCWVMGGVGGHAGLFSNAPTIHVLLRSLRNASLKKESLISKETFETFFRPDPKRRWEEIYFTLGCETPTKGMSQSGTLFSKNSIGHLGYAGTSFWWDLERDFWIILLTNRCMPQRKNYRIQQFRPDLHDLVVKEFNL